MLNASIILAVNNRSVREKIHKNISDLNNFINQSGASENFRAFFLKPDKHIFFFVTLHILYKVLLANYQVFF